ASGFNATLDFYGPGWFVEIPVVVASWHDLVSYGLAAEREQFFELIGRHFGEPVLAAADNVFGKGPFLLDHHIDALFQCSNTEELVHLYIAFLPNTKGSIGSLILHCRVPPAIEMEHVIGRREVEANAAGLQREDEEGRAVPVFLEALHHEIALFLGRTAVQEEDLAAEGFLEVVAQQGAHLGELGEN